MLASLNAKNGKASYDMNGRVSLISVTNEIIALSQELLMCTPKPEDVFNTVKSLHSVCKHLAAVVTLATGDVPQLPEKEQITPNQHSWTETVLHMGVKWIKKGQGKVDSALTAEHISEINCKRNCGDKDPYGAGEQSGKHAKQDACSAGKFPSACYHKPSPSFISPSSSATTTRTRASSPSSITARSMAC